MHQQRWHSPGPRVRAHQKSDCLSVMSEISHWKLCRGRSVTVVLVQIYLIRFLEDCHSFGRHQKVIVSCCLQQSLTKCKVEHQNKTTVWRINQRRASDTSDKIIEIWAVLNGPNFSPEYFKENKISQPIKLPLFGRGRWNVWWSELSPVVAANNSCLINVMGGWTRLNFKQLKYLDMTFYAALRKVEHNFTRFETLYLGDPYVNGIDTNRDYISTGTTVSLTCRLHFKSA